MSFSTQTNQWLHKLNQFLKPIQSQISVTIDSQPPNLKGLGFTDFFHND